MSLVPLLFAPAAVAALLAPQDPVPSAIAFRQACLDATSDAVVMNVAAHPDDESARTMVYLRHKYGLRTVTVYSTCGEGGQNAVGREIGRALAAIRVGETRAAAARYGTEIRWLGFPDFGYSKSLDETLAVWGRDEALARMRATLDAVAPDVVLTNHSADRGHGHHQASYLAIVEACRARSAELGREVALYRRGSAPAEGEDAPEPWFAFDAGELDLVRGQTFARQAHDAWTLHRSQGPWGAHDPTRVRPDVWVQAFPAAADGDATAARAPLARLGNMFALPEVTAALDDVDGVRAALLAFVGDRPIGQHVAAARDLLPRLRALWAALPVDAHEARARVGRRIEALERVVFHGSGLALDVFMPADQAAVGEAVELRIAVRGANAADVVARCAGAEAAPDGGDWLVARPTVPTAAFADPITELTRTVVLPLTVDLSVFGTAVTVRRDVVVALAAESDIAWDRGHAYVPGRGAWTRVFSLDVTHHGREPLDAALSFRMPAGVRADAIPARVRLEPGQRRARALVKLTWSPGGSPDAPAAAVRDAPIEVLASLGDARARLSLQPVPLPADLPPPRIAIVGGPDDTVQRTLEDLGLQVDALDETDLATAELAAFDVLLLDIRAYHHRPDLANHRERILAFCRAGGRVAAFYHKPREWNEAPGKPLLAPFALQVGGGRVSEEDAVVELLEPGHPLWNRPFSIGAADFEGWVQERGLNFPSEWDPAWVPLLSTHDRGEEPLRGALLYGRYGRGDYVYCSLAVYRQLRVGHPGAVRILLNLLWR